MTDKIITTFETTLTWFDPMDKVPNKSVLNVLIYLKKGFLDYVTYFKFDSESIDEWHRDCVPVYDTSEIMWWCYLPEFD